MAKHRSKSPEEEEEEEEQHRREAENETPSKKEHHKSKRKVEDDPDSEEDSKHRRSGKKRGRRSRSKSRRKYSDEDDDSYSSSSESDSEDSDTESESGSSEHSDSKESEEERRRRKRRERKKREEREKEKRRRREKEKKRRRKEREEEEARRRKKKKKKKSKDKKDKEGKKGAVTNSWGKYGIIRETDMWNKRPEFTAWLAEVKQVNLESLPNWEEKQMFKQFMEDHNTGTFPSKKYYNLDAYYKSKMEKQLKKGLKQVMDTERIIFNDEEQRRQELNLERQKAKEKEVEALMRSMQGGMAQAMKEQALLREEMALQYKLGNLEAAAAIQRRLDPDVAM